MRLKPISSGVIAVIVLFAVTRLFILFGFEPQASDVSVYFGNAARAFDLKHTPYAGDFPIEFPPVAWWTMALARELAGSDVSLAAASRETALDHYVRSYRRLMAIADAAAFALFISIVRRRDTISAGLLALYTVCTALLAHPLYDRLDAGLLFLLMAVVYAWVRMSEQPDAVWSPWRLAAYLIVGIGIAYKLIPLMIVPFFLLFDWKRSSRWLALSIGSAAVVLGAGLPFALQYLVSGPGVFRLVTFHAGRGVQLESLFATLMALAQPLGFPVHIELWEGGVNLSSGLAGGMVTASTIAFSTGVLGLVLFCGRHLVRYDATQAWRAGCLAIAGMVILSRVFSPQYLIWALPLLLLVMAELFRSSRAMAFGGLALIGIAALTAWVFPHHYFGFGVMPFWMQPVRGAPERLTPSFVLLGLRNGLYLMFVVVITLRFSRSLSTVAASTRTPTRHRKRARRAVPTARTRLS